MNINSGLEFNKSYNGSYIILPLKKEHNGLTVSTTSSTKEHHLDDKLLYELQVADHDKNHCLTLDEINNVPNKSEFFKKLQQAMQDFDLNSNRDYRENFFEIFL